MSSSNNNNASQEEGLMQHIQRSCGNCWASTMTCSANAKETAYIKKLEYDLTSRQKKFGVDYLVMEAEGKSPDELQACLDQAKSDIAELKKQIDAKTQQIDTNKEELQRKVQASKTESTPGNAPATSSTSAPAKTSSPAATTPAATSTPAASVPPPAETPATTMVATEPSAAATTEG